MVLPAIILAVALGVFIFGFGGSISGAITDRLKTPEQRAVEAKQREVEAENAQKRADKGAIDNTFDFIFGEKAGDAVRKKKANEAIATADAEIERQARAEGFANRDELALATDSGSLVVGSSKNTIDFGLIGAPEAAIVAKPRFGGQATAPKEPEPLIEKTRGAKRFGR